jgi:uncharacterized protein (TIGR02001 family)
MRTILNAATIALVSGLPVAAVAQELTFSANIELTSEYVSQGFELSDGPALQIYAEAAYAGFYLGALGTNGSQDLLGADTEVDFYLGRAGDIGKFYYDIGVAYYFFKNVTFAEDYEEYYANVGYAVTPSLYATVYYGHAPITEQHDIALTVDYYTNFSGLAVSATYGDVRTNFGDWNYWSVGGSYEVSDALSVDLTYYGADDNGALLGVTDGILTATIAYAF